MRALNPAAAPLRWRFGQRCGLSVLCLFVLMSVPCRAQKLPAPIVPIAAPPPLPPSTAYTLDPKSTGLALQFSFSRNATTGVYSLNSAGPQPANVVVDYSDGTSVAPTSALKLKLTFTVNAGLPNQVTASFTTTAPTAPDALKAGAAANAPTTYTFPVLDVAKAVIAQLNNHLPPNLDPTTQTFNWNPVALSVIIVNIDPVTGKATNGGESTVNGGPLVVTFKELIGDNATSAAGGGGAPAQAPAANQGNAPDGQ